MTLAPLKIINKCIRVRSMILVALLIAFIVLSLFISFQWVTPSIGRTNEHIAADSDIYTQFADSIRSGEADPVLVASLLVFPNTLLCPVLLALVFKGALAIAFANYAMFFLALILLKKSYSFSVSVFMGLLLLNPTTTVSLISVNKEIVDLLAVSIFLFARQRRHYGLLLVAILLGILNRYEVSVVMILLICVESKFNPWRERRVVTLIALVIAMSIMLPLFASGNLNARFDNQVGEGQGHAVVMLDMLEMHYLYAAAVIPKTAENLFGEFVSAYSKSNMYFDFSDIANTYIMFFNNLANAAVLYVLIRYRRFTVRSDIFYFAMLGWIIGAVALVIQPRYIYFVYFLLCFQAAQTGNASVIRHK